jgi:hypothetical protein
VLAELVARFDPQARPQPALSLLDVQVPFYRLTLAQISSLFAAAARLQPANLSVGVTPRWPGLVIMPQLEHTKSITLDMPGVSLGLPQNPEGDMPQLESLSFRHYDAILGGLLHWCSALRSVSIHSLHLDSIMINLPLVEELVLYADVQLRKVSIVAPRLKKLIFCAIEGFVQNFSVRCFAPKVENLNWSCRAPDVCFGDIWCLMDWNIKTSEPLRQLQHHPPSNTLSLNIFERSMVILLCPFLLNFSSVLTKLTSYLVPHAAKLLSSLFMKVP